MGSRIQSHQLSNGLYVSGRPEQQQKDKPTMGSRAVPYTGGDVKKSGELGKMFDIQILEGPGPHPPPSLKSSRPSTSGSLRSGSGSISGPLSSKHTTSSGPMTRKSSGPMPLQPTGLITSGPLGSSTGRRSGHLDSGSGFGPGKPSYGAAVTSLGSGAEVRVGIGVSKAAVWVFVVAVAMGLLIGAFLMVAVTTRGSKTELQLGFRKPAVVIIVGVNGGGKTTSLGKLAYRLKSEGAKILMAAGDTFRAAASDQLEIWAERTGCEIVVAEKDKAKASSGRQLNYNVLSQAVKRGKEQGFDVVLCDTSGRLHTNFSLMEELIACKKAVGKIVPGAPNEILLVLDGTTGLNMLPQAREFNEVVGITGLILTKLDGSARGGCVVSVVDELGIPVKFVGVGEGVEDLQPFDAEAFVNAIFS